MFIYLVNPASRIFIFKFLFKYKKGKEKEKGVSFVLKELN